MLNLIIPAYRALPINYVLLVRDVYCFLLIVLRIPPTYYCMRLSHLILLTCYVLGSSERLLPTSCVAIFILHITSSHYVWLHLITGCLLLLTHLACSYCYLRNVTPKCYGLFLLRITCYPADECILTELLAWFTYALLVCELLTVCLPAMLLAGVLQREFTGVFACVYVRR